MSATGKKVSAFRIGTVPLHCQGVNPSANPGSGTISKKGKFTVKLSLYFPPTRPGRHVGTLTVSGAFSSRGRESGKLAAKYGANGFSSSCNTTVGYSTRR